VAEYSAINIGSLKITVAQANLQLPLPIGAKCPLRTGSSKRITIRRLAIINTPIQRSNQQITQRIITIQNRVD
jgi:hypothetical protein